MNGVSIMTNRCTALVTGASDGIGLEFCKELAAKRFDLILVARREDKLNEAAAILTKNHGVACHVLPCDLAKTGAAQSLYNQTKSKGLKVDFLVNNAGLLFNGAFDEIDLKKQEDLLAVNISALTSLTLLYLQDMVARKSGYILNVASTAAWIGIPQQNVYAASKSYVLAFTIALNDEMNAKNTGVHVTAVCPNYTETNMLHNPAQGAKLSVPKFMILSAEFVAIKGVAACLKGKAMVIPGISNRLNMMVVQMIPKVWVTRIFGVAYRKGQSSNK